MNYSSSIENYEYAINKPKNTFRIIGLGDSFTFGWGLNITDTYLKILENKLNNHFQTNIEVLNFGIPGACTTSEVELFELYAKKFSPDLLILQFTGGDEYDIEVEEKRRPVLLYFLERELIGLGRSDPVIRDPFVEDIGCNGPNTPLYLYHRVFGSMRTNVTYPHELELNRYILIK